MATSSILEKITVNNPKVMEQFSLSLDSPYNNSFFTPQTAHLVTSEDNSDVLDALMKEGIKNWSKNESLGL